MRHLLNSSDLSKDEILSLFEKAKRYLEVVKGRTRVNDANGKILATLFYEPSTRTRFSFETAMLRLGGHVISNAQMNDTSSAKKGETLYDTGKVVSQLADIIAMRHPESKSVGQLAAGSEVPVVNGGNGAGDHPTQGLLDLFTMLHDIGRLENLTITMVGDLKYSRVLHSQCVLLSQFKDIRFRLISPAALRMPVDIVNDLKAKGFQVEEREDLEAALPGTDVISLTRVQQERFPSPEDFLKYRGMYVFTPELLQKTNDDSILIHPLPRLDELPESVDADTRARYFEQVQNGVAVRMAILSTLLEL